MRNSRVMSREADNIFVGQYFCWTLLDYSAKCVEPRPRSSDVSWPSKRMDFISYKHYRLLKFYFFTTGLTPYKPMLLSVMHTTIVCLILLLGQTFSIFFLMENNICPSRFFSSQICITVLITGVNVTYGLLLVKSVNIEEWLKDIKRD